MKKSNEEIEKEYNEMILSYGKNEKITMKTYNKIVKPYIKDIERLMKVILKQNNKYEKICKLMVTKYRIEIEIKK